MKLTIDTGTALVILNDAIKTMRFVPGYYRGSYLFSRPGEEVEGEDYDSRFDVYFRQSDDGSRCYDTVRVISTMETSAPSLPDRSEISRTAALACAKVMTEVAAGRTHSDDLAFAIRIFNSATWQHKAWQENGEDLDLAQAAILTDVFQIS